MDLDIIEIINHIYTKLIHNGEIYGSNTIYDIGKCNTIIKLIQPSIKIIYDLIVNPWVTFDQS